MMSSSPVHQRQFMSDAGIEGLDARTLTLVALVAVVSALVCELRGFVIVGVQPFWQQVAVGAVLIAAVWVDQARRAAAMRGNTQSLWRRLVSGFRRG